MIELFENVYQYRIFVYVIVTLLGLFIGSFLNVVALRLLKEESIVLPASHCPKCKEPIKFYDNIPLLSWLILGGKCRNCKVNISIQYPLVEFATGFLFFLCIFCFGLSFKALFMMILCASLVVITVTDLYEHLIFDVTSLPLVPLGLLYNLFNLGQVDRPDFVFQLFPKSFGLEIGNLLQTGAIHLPGIFVSGIMGIILSIVFFEGLNFLSEKFLGKMGFGMGDTKLCAGLGAFFGWEMLAIIILISFIAQAFFGIPVLAYKLYQNKEMKSIYSLAGTIVFAAIPILVNVVWNVPPKTALWITLPSFAIVLYCVIIFLKEARKKSEPVYLPLGPAIVFAAFIIMFYFEPIQVWFTNLTRVLGYS